MQPESSRNSTPSWSTVGDETSIICKKLNKGGSYIELPGIHDDFTKHRSPVAHILHPPQTLSTSWASKHYLCDERWTDIHVCVLEQFAHYKDLYGKIFKSARLAKVTSQCKQFNE